MLVVQLREERQQSILTAAVPAAGVCWTPSLKARPTLTPPPLPPHRRSLLSCAACARLQSEILAQDAQRGMPCALSLPSAAPPSSAGGPRAVSMLPAPSGAATMAAGAPAPLVRTAAGAPQDPSRQHWTSSTPPDAATTTTIATTTMHPPVVLPGQRTMPQQQDRSTVAADTPCVDSAAVAPDGRPRSSSSSPPATNGPSSMPP